MRSPTHLVEQGRPPSWDPPFSCTSLVSIDQQLSPQWVAVQEVGLQMLKRELALTE